jgi:hypothetical protein
MAHTPVSVCRKRAQDRPGLLDAAGGSSRVTAAVVLGVLHGRVVIRLLLWHGDDIYDETPDAKLLGVYSAPERAEARKSSATRLPGFRDHPDALEVVRYEIDHDEWTEGFVPGAP